jgi:hypothetical protein
MSISAEEMAALLGALLAGSEIMSRMKGIKPNGWMDLFQVIARALRDDAQQKAKKNPNRPWFR